MSGDLAPFDVCGPLPVGTVVLEASAGTGKTTTIASLAVRYVAEGVVRLPELLLVTFGRLATSELRERVRDRLVEVERALRTGDLPADDPVITLLAGTDSQIRAARLTVALAEFDAATITTTHGFCQQMLASLGTIGDVEPDARLVPDIADLEAEVVDDLYLRKYKDTAEPLLTRDGGPADRARGDQRLRRRRWSRPTRLPGRPHGTRTGSPSPRAPSCSAASARSTCSTTTTCWCSCGTRSWTARSPPSASGRGTAS